MVIHPILGILIYNGYINPCKWINDHPPMLPNPTVDPGQALPQAPQRRTYQVVARPYKWRLWWENHRTEWGNVFIAMCEYQKL